MSRDSGVTYDHVRQACYEILSRSERPSRPSVQELLASDRYVGRKGSNDLVQKFINDFWANMAKTLQVPPRTVEGVPEVFVPIIDKALGEMVAVARQLATEEFTDREAAMDKRVKEIEASVQDARDSAFAADQLRVRAEGELTALHAMTTELKSHLIESERKLAEETRKVEAHQRAIDEKDNELRLQFASLEAANRAMEQANEQHRQEAHRLLRQIDSDRQEARKEGKRLVDQLEKSRAETEAARNEAAKQREEIAHLRAEGAAVKTTAGNLEETVKDGKVRVESLELKLQTAQQEVAVMRTRYETAEQYRQEALSQNLLQAEEFRELRRENERLARDLGLARSERGDSIPP